MGILAVCESWNNPIFLCFNNISNILIRLSFATAFKTLNNIVAIGFYFSRILEFWNFKIKTIP